jgi:hypothetical protein
MQYVDGFKLRHFCGFELLNVARGLSCLKDYHRAVEAAVANSFGMINGGLRYRASRDWGELIGFSKAIAEINILGIEFTGNCARICQRKRRCWSVGAIGRGATPTRRPYARRGGAEDYHSSRS